MKQDGKLRNPPLAAVLVRVCLVEFLAVAAMFTLIGPLTHLAGQPLLKAPWPYTAILLAVPLGWWLVGTIGWRAWACRHGIDSRLCGGNRVFEALQEAERTRRS
jgi:hypothetical protein